MAAACMDKLDSCEPTHLPRLLGRIRGHLAMLMLLLLSVPMRMPCHALPCRKLHFLGVHVV